MFASAINTQCTRFFYKMLAPGCDGVDAFSVHWGGAENRWMFPPVSYARRMVYKIAADSATEMVILPVCQAQAWWADAVAVDQAYLFPSKDGRLLSGNTQLPVPHPKWQMAAFRFVGGGRSAAAARRPHSRMQRAARQAVTGAVRPRIARGVLVGPAAAHRGTYTASSWPEPMPDAALIPLRPPCSGASRWATAPAPPTPPPGCPSPATSSGKDGKPFSPRPLPSPSSFGGSGGGRPSGQ